jgi:hypothetical protein
MSRPKTLQVGVAGLVSRYRDGTITHTCQHCHCWQEWPRWGPAIRFARQHDAAHQATALHYNRGPREDRELAQRPTGPPLLGRLAIIALALLLFALTATAVASHATPAPTPAPVPSIAVVPTTAPAAPTPEGYVPTQAGPPATNADGTWIPEPNQPPAPPTSSNAGGGR